MTSGAVVGSTHMQGALARGNDTIMATDTASQHVSVIHRGFSYRLPRCWARLMTLIAIRG